MIETILIMLGAVLFCVTPGFIFEEFFSLKKGIYHYKITNIDSSDFNNYILKSDK